MFLTEEEIFEPGVYQLEMTDPVQGGPNGIDNLQAKQLANRTNWLKANKQDKDATLTAIAALITAADKLIYATGSDTFATTTLTAFARTLLDDVDAATMRTTLGAVSQADINSAISALINSSPAALDTLNELASALGNDANFATTMTNALAGKQPIDTTLTAIAALTTAADKLIYATGADTFSTTTLTAFARTLLDDMNGETMFSTLGATQSLGNSGYTKLPNNLIFQWGETAAVQSSVITFPIAFPTACIGVFVISTASENLNTYTSAISLTQFTHGGNAWTASGFATKNWFAIGY